MTVVLGQIEQPRQNKNLVYRHEKPNEPTKEGPISHELFESPFTSVPIKSWGHPFEKSFALFTFLLVYTLVFGWVFIVRKRERAKKIPLSDNLVFN